MDTMLKELMDHKATAKNDAIVQELELLIKYVNNRILESHQRSLDSALDSRNLILDTQQQCRDLTTADAKRLKRTLQRNLKNIDGIISYAKDRIKASLELKERLASLPTALPH